RHEDTGGVGAGLVDGFGHGIEDGHALVLAAPPARDHAAHHLGAHLSHLLRVERALAAGDALYQDLVVRVEQDAHRVTAPWPRSSGRPPRRWCLVRSRSACASRAPPPGWC